MKDIGYDNLYITRELLEVSKKYEEQGIDPILPLHGREVHKYFRVSWVALELCA